MGSIHRPESPVYSTPLEGDSADKKSINSISKDQTAYQSDSDDGEYTSTHVFQDPEIAKHYSKLYEDAQYEGKDHFDPSFEWTPKEERRLVRKLDIYVALWAFIMFLALDIDRYNLANAISGTFFEDLHLTTADYNLGNTVNLICFLAAEFPSQMMSKWLGADRWIPAQIIMWSIVATCQCFMKNRAGFLATRCLVGFLEGGFIPDICLWMSYFYKSNELSTRLGYFYVANPLTQAISALLAYGIFHLQGHTNWAGWRWVFLIEGLVTLTLGILSIVQMRPSAVQTKTWYDKKGWFNDREEKIIVNRILRDDPSKGDMRARQALTVGQIWRSLQDFDLWPIYADRLLIDIIQGQLEKYLPIILRGQGFSTLNTNLLMIPPCIIEIITLLAQAHLSKYLNEYGLVLAISPLWFIPTVGAMKFWPGFLRDKWASYGLLILTLGAPPSWVLSVTWCSVNSNSVSTRTVSAAVVNIFSQLASIVGSNVFRPDDAPRYSRGVGQLFAIAIAGTVAVVLTKVYYVWRNRQREKQWSGLSPTAQLSYIDEAARKGNKRLDFRFAT